VLDPYGEWAAVRGVASDGCVLIRPDRHVAWRAPRFDAETVRQFSEAFRRALGQRVESGRPDGHRESGD
jgi:2,4-dichlorophenol 6-monooxygenase